MLELVLAQPVQEVGLVLVLVARPAQDRAAVGSDLAAGVVAGCHRVAVVQVACPPEQCPELHVGVAVDARAGRPPIDVRVEEGLEHAGVELALEVHDVERDPELRRDPARVVGGIERAAALLELGVRVRDVVEAHPHPDRLVAGLVDERGRDRGIHARPTSRRGRGSCDHALAKRVGRNERGRPAHRREDAGHDVRPRSRSPRRSWSARATGAGRRAPPRPGSPSRSGRARPRSSRSCTPIRPSRRSLRGRARPRQRSRRCRAR